MAYEADGCVVWDRPDDEVSDESVVELRVKLSDVLAAEDAREECQEGTHGGCDVFAAREGRGRGRIAGECGHALVTHQPVAQPKAEPETLDEGEPDTPTEGLEASLGLSLDPSLAIGLDRGLVESLAQTLARTLAESEDEDELEALVAC